MPADRIDLGQPIAQGRTAEIFAWQAGRVLKLYRSEFANGLPDYEARIARLVHASNAASPAVGELVQVNGRIGLEYERIEGRSALEIILARPWRAAWAGRICAQVHVQMHASPGAGLSNQHQRLASKIQSAPGLPPDLRARLIRQLEQLPEGGQLCHGDFHPGNLILSPRGPVVIDWVDAVSGHPMADMARTAILVRYSSLPRHPMSLLLHIMRSVFFQAYLNQYFSLSPGRRADFQHWLPVVAAARLEEGIASEEQNLLRLAAGE